MCVCVCVFITPCSLGDPQEFSVQFNDQLCLMLSNASEELKTDLNESQSEFRSALLKI